MNIEYIYRKSYDQPFWFRLLMTPLSLLFLYLVKFRVLVYRLGLKQSMTLDPRVISVGNISVGGTGKTPFVIALCKKILNEGGRPAILTRGYKSGLRSGELAVLQCGRYIIAPDTEITLAADEAMMQSVKLPEVPVVVCANRYWAAQVFIERSEYRPTHWILDDGFQHWKIKRDLDIVLLNKSNPFASGSLLPLGFLREPVSALKRADLVVWTGEGQVKAEDAKIAELYGRLFIDTKTKILKPELKHGEAKSTDFKGIKVAAVSAIARPERFILSLNSLDIHPDLHVSFPDHQRFVLSDLIDRVRGFDAVITTEKDYWRDQGIFDRLGTTVYTLPIEIEISELILEL